MLDGHYERVRTRVSEMKTGVIFILLCVMQIVVTKGFKVLFFSNLSHIFKVFIRLTLVFRGRGPLLVWRCNVWVDVTWGMREVS